MEIYYYIATYFTKKNSGGTKATPERCFYKAANPELWTLEKYGWGIFKKLELRL